MLHSVTTVVWFTEKWLFSQFIQQNTQKRQYFPFSPQTINILLLFKRRQTWAGQQDAEVNVFIVVGDGNED